MKPGQTLWEMLRAKWQGKPPGAPIEFYNPLNHQIGSVVLVDVPGGEYQGIDFSVRTILETDREIGARIFRFTDYVLEGADADGDRLTLRLRCMPNRNGGCDMILLELADELKFDPGFLAVVNDTTGQFNITDDQTQAMDCFERINHMQGSYHTVVRELTSTKAGSIAPPDQERHYAGEYWDYWRETPPAQIKEFVFIELRSETGWFQIWRGREYI